MPRRLRDDDLALREQLYSVIRVTAVSRLREVLDARGMTQAACARRIDVSIRHLNRLAAGDLPRLDVAFLLEAALSTPIHDVFVPNLTTLTLR